MPHNLPKGTGTLGRKHYGHPTQTCQVGVTWALSTCVKVTEPRPGSSEATAHYRHSMRKRNHLILQENNVCIKNRTLTILNYLHDSL